MGKVSDYSEWYCIGEGEEFDSELAQSKINDFFSQALLYLVTDRHQSKEIQNALIKFPELTIYNKNFNRYITFNKIGIAKQGVFNN